MKILLLLLYSSWLLATPNHDKILLSVIDTGIDLKNSDLKKYLWTNPGESGLDQNNNPKESNGIDDDKNGFVDDLHGWNFVDNNNDIQDFHGHGTHIVSIILDFLKKNGYENKIEIQIVKYYHSDQDTHNILKASNNSFRYAQIFSPNFVNYSGGGYTPSREEKQILEKFDINKTLIIAASGNQRNNNDKQPYFPASYNLQNMISVGSISAESHLSKFSNFGKSTVNLFTLGEAVPAISLNNKLIKLSGTSQATAKLTAYAIYLFQESESQSPHDLLDFLCNLTKQSKNLETISTCGKMILDNDISKFRGKTQDLFHLALEKK